MTKLTRAAQHHTIMAVIGKPKPTKEKKVKRVPVARQRKRLEKQIEELVKLIIFWRDGQQCVMSKMDGGRCGNGLMWNHFIAQKQSHYLRLDLGNVFVGCGNHNMLDFHGDKTLSIWFMATFGVDTAARMAEQSKEHAGHKWELCELEALLAHYDELYQNRYTVDIELEPLIMAGYYGEIIKKKYGVRCPECYTKYPDETPVTCPVCGHDLQEIR